MVFDVTSTLGTSIVVAVGVPPVLSAGMGKQSQVPGVSSKTLRNAIAREHKACHPEFGDVVVKQLYGLRAVPTTFLNNGGTAQWVAVTDTALRHRSFVWLMAQLEVTSAGAGAGAPGGSAETWEEEDKEIERFGSPIGMRRLNRVAWERLAFDRGGYGGASPPGLIAPHLIGTPHVGHGASPLGGISGMFHPSRDDTNTNNPGASRLGKRSAAQRREEDEDAAPPPGPAVLYGQTVTGTVSDADAKRLKGDGSVDAGDAAATTVTDDEVSAAAASVAAARLLAEGVSDLFKHGGESSGTVPLRNVMFAKSLKSSNGFLGSVEALDVNGELVSLLPSATFVVNEIRKTQTESGSNEFDDLLRRLRGLNASASQATGEASLKGSSAGSINREGVAAPEDVVNLLAVGVLCARVFRGGYKVRTARFPNPPTPCLPILVPEGTITSALTVYSYTYKTEAGDCLSIHRDTQDVDHFSCNPSKSRRGVPTRVTHALLSVSKTARPEQFGVVGRAVIEMCLTELGYDGGETLTGGAALGGGVAKTGEAKPTNAVSAPSNASAPFADKNEPQNGDTNSHQPAVATKPASPVVATKKPLTADSPKTASKAIVASSSSSGDEDSDETNDDDSSSSSTEDDSSSEKPTVQPASGVVGTEDDVQDTRRKEDNEKEKEKSSSESDDSDSDDSDSGSDSDSDSSSSNSSSSSSSSAEKKDVDEGEAVALAIKIAEEDAVVKRGNIARKKELEAKKAAAAKSNTNQQQVGGTRPIQGNQGAKKPPPISTKPAPAAALAEFRKESKNQHLATSPGSLGRLLKAATAKRRKTTNPQNATSRLSTPCSNAATPAGASPAPALQTVGEGHAAAGEYLVTKNKEKSTASQANKTAAETAAEPTTSDAGKTALAARSSGSADAGAAQRRSTRSESKKGGTRTTKEAPKKDTTATTAKPVTQPSVVSVAEKNTTAGTTTAVNDSSAALLKDSPDLIPVTCGTKRGYYVVSEKKVLFEGVKIPPAKFETLANIKTKRWKRSIKVDGEVDARAVNIGEMLDILGIDTAAGVDAPKHKAMVGTPGAKK